MSKWLSLGEDPSKGKEGQPGETESTSETPQNCPLKGKGCIYVSFRMQVLVNLTLNPVVSPSCQSQLRLQSQEAGETQ